MSKNVLVLPGTQWQVPLIEKIQEMGHKALVVNPDSEAPGMKKADLCLISDIFDKNETHFGHRCDGRSRRCLFFSLARDLLMQFWFLNNPFCPPKPSNHLSPPYCVRGDFGG